MKNLERFGKLFDLTGHVAVVTQLLENKIRIAEQNVLHTPLPRRILPLAKRRKTRARTSMTASTE